MSPTLVGSRCIRLSVTLYAECEQKNPIEKPFKFCIRPSVTLCAECEQKNPIEKPFRFCIRRNITLCAECERYTGYSINKENIRSFAHITRGSSSDVRREANEDRLKRIRERDRNLGHRESLRDPGQNICSDCFNRVLDFY